MIDSSKWFYFVGGKSAKNIGELEQVFRTLSEQEFTFHVNGEKNDFAAWIEGIFNEKDLAKDLRRVFEKREAHGIIERFLRHHNNDNHVSEQKHENHVALSHHAHEEKHEHHEIAHQLSKKFEQTETSFAHDVYDKPLEIESKEVLQIPEFDTNLSPGGFESSKDIIVESESNELDKEQLKDLAEDAKHDLEIEGRMIVHDKKLSDLDTAHAHIDVDRKLIVKEFIYGFLMGLVFGFILLGVLMQVNICY